MNYPPSLASIIPAMKMLCCQCIGTKDVEFLRLKSVLEIYQWSNLYPSQT